MTDHHQPSASPVRSTYDRSYKWLLLFPAILFILSLGYLFSFSQTHGDVIYKDVSLTGGTTVTVFDASTDILALRTALQPQFPDISARSISDIRTGTQHGFFVATQADATTLKKALEHFLGYSLTSENSSVEFSGATLSAGFYAQLRNAMMAAFLLMAWVVFFIFTPSRKAVSIATMLTFLSVAILLSGISFVKVLSLLVIIGAFAWGLFHERKHKRESLMTLAVFIVSLALFFFYPASWIVALCAVILAGLYIVVSVPSIAVIFAAFADIVMTVAVVDLLGIHLSSAGIIAFLMLIGYSVDTDILLTTRLLKSNEGTVNQRIAGAFKTGMTMTLTAIAAIGVAFIAVYTFSDTLRQIFGIILLGLFFDILNTWVTNASILKWYVEAKHL